MVQHAARLDHIKAAGKLRKIEDVGLRVLYVANGHGVAHPLGVGETAYAQIDGQHLRADKSTRRRNGLLSGAASSHENLQMLAARIFGETR